MVDDVERAREDYKASILYYKEEGREEGREEQTYSIARNMLNKGVSLEFIQSVTGLKAEEVHALQENRQ